MAYRTGLVEEESWKMKQFFSKPVACHRTLKSLSRDMWTTTLRIRIIATPSAWDACQALHPSPQHNKPTLSWNSDLSLYPNINMDILHTVLYTFPKVLTRRISLTINSLFHCWSFPLFSWPLCVIHGWYCREKFDAGHSWGPKGYRFIFCTYSVSLGTLLKQKWNKRQH